MLSADAPEPPLLTPVLSLLARAMPRGRAAPRPEHTLSDLGITSLRLVALIADLEDDLGIPFEHISWLRPHSTVAALLGACSAVPQSL